MLTEPSLLKSLVRTPEMSSKVVKNKSSMAKYYCKNTFCLSCQLTRNCLIQNFTDDERDDDFGGLLQIVAAADNACAALAALIHGWVRVREWLTFVRNE
jgi:hypothetical protein